VGDVFRRALCKVEPYLVVEIALDAGPVECAPQTLRPAQDGALSRKPQDFAHGFRQEIPFRTRLVQLPLTSSRQPVQPGTSLVLSDLPFRHDPAGLFHAVKGRVQRTFFDAKHIVGDALNMSGDAVPVCRTPTQGREHQQVKRALEGIWLSESAQHTQKSRVE
jgi:hypothetical protein